LPILPTRNQGPIIGAEFLWENGVVQGAAVTA
jgi:hypothetical protein